MDLSRLDYYILGEVVACVLSLVLCFNIFMSFSFSDIKHRLFMYGGVSSFIATLFDVFSVFCITYYKDISYDWCVASSTVFFLFLLGIPLVLADYVLNLVSYKQKFSKIGYAINGVVYTIWSLIVLVNVKTGWIFRFDAELGYVRGPLKNLTYYITAYYAIFAIIVTMGNLKRLPRRMIMVFVGFPIVSMIFLVIQFVDSKVLLTGTASFSALLFAYITIQSDLLDYDTVTGLMSESKLKRYITGKNGSYYLYILSIDNMNMIQTNMEVAELNNLLVNLAKEFVKHFEKKCFCISNNRFCGIARAETEIIEFSKCIEQYIVNLNTDMNTILPTPLETYCAAIACSNDNESYENVIEVINSRLQKSKNDGIRTLKFCDDAILVDMERKRVIHKILKRELNLDSQQFQVWFQPIYSIGENKFTYMEALSRLRNTELGDIPPGEFVAVAESRGLIEKLGFVAFEKVCKYMSENKDLITAVSINFSVYQMTNPNLVQNVLTTIEKFNLRPSNIIMEITESIFIENYDLVLKNMTDLAVAGVQFYLDDFGTGYSNLANVVGLPFSTIKMDRSLVLMMEENDKGIRLFQNLVETFKDAGFKILVEGVETNDQNTLVTAAGVDYIQGFLYSRPLPGNECLDAFRKQKLKIEKAND